MYTSCRKPVRDYKVLYDYSKPEDPYRIDGTRSGTATSNANGNVSEGQWLDQNSRSNATSTAGATGHTEEELQGTNRPRYDILMLVGTPVMRQ